MTATKGSPDSERGAEELKQLREYCDRARSYRDSDPAAALWMARKAAESICRRVFEREIGTPGSSLTLDGFIEKLVARRALPRHILVPLRAIQGYGNYGTHDQGDDSSVITSEYVQPCLDSLATAADWYATEFCGEAEGFRPSAAGSAVGDRTAPGASTSNRSSKSRPRLRGARPLVLAASALIVGLLAGWLIHRTWSAPPADPGLHALYYPDRSAIGDLRSALENAHDNIDILQTNATTILELVPLLQTAKKRSPNLAVRLLLLDPQGRFVGDRARMMAADAADQFRSESQGSLSGLAMRTGGDSEGLALRLYDEPPTFVMFRIDNRLIICFITAVRLGRDLPHIEITTDMPNARECFLGHFERLWERSAPYDPKERG